MSYDIWGHWTDNEDDADECRCNCEECEERRQQYDAPKVETDLWQKELYKTFSPETDLDEVALRRKVAELERENSRLRQTNADLDETVKRQDAEYDSYTTRIWELRDELAQIKRMNANLSVQFAQALLNDNTELYVKAFDGTITMGELRRLPPPIRRKIWNLSR